MVATNSDSGTLTSVGGSPGGCVTSSVFISYRREDCPGHAGRLFDHLRTRFGQTSVFMDVTDIEAGVDFVEVLQRAVGSCDVLLAVIGREWLTCTDRNGRRRLDDPHDFIRLEVGIALARNVRVIPVLVEGAVMPTASELPSDLEGLTRRQAVELRDARWNADVESLTAVLERVLGRRSAGHDSAGNPRRHTTLWALAGVALLAAAAAAVTLVPRDGSTPYGPVLQRVFGTSALEEQRPIVQSRPPGSPSPGPAATTNRPPATTQPTTRAAAPPAPQRPATATAPPARPAPEPAPTQPSPTTEAQGREAPSPGSSGSVLVSYTADEDRNTAEDLAAELRKSINDAQYGVRTLKTPRSIGSEPEVRYSSSGFSTLAETLARSAGPSLSRTYGRRVAFRPTLDPRVPSRNVIVVMPARTPAVAGRSADAVVTIAYTTTDDPKIAEGLATFLRTRSGTEYQVRTLRSSASRGKEGQIEHDKGRMAGLAQVLAREAAPWISRTYGREVVLRPTLSARIGADAVVLWLPSR